MKSMFRAFTDHPESVGESYFEHLKSASGFSARMAIGAIACLLHGLFPFLCTKTGSRQITLLHDRMVAHRCKHAPAENMETLSAPSRAPQPAE